MAAALLALASTLSVVQVARVARAETPPSRDTCKASYELGQRLRRAKKLLAAREKLVLCARDPCPTLFQPECARWLAQVDAEIPTIVVTIDDPSGEQTNARAFVDDMPLAVDGIAHPVDPGERILRVTWGPNVVTRGIRVVEGVHAQRFVVTPDRAPTPAAVAQPQADASQASVPVPPPTTRSVPFATYALGGVALASAGVFTYFWFTGVEDRRELARTCAPFCTDQQVDPVRTKILVADIALVTAITAAASAVLVWVLAPSSPRAKGALGIPGPLRF